MKKSLFLGLLLCVIFILGCPGKSRKIKSRISKNDSAPASAYYDLGIVAGQAGKLDVAISYLKKAIKKRPNYDDAYSDLGLAYLKQNRISEAQEAFLKAIEINPQNAPALMNYAIILLRNKRYQDGKIYLERAVAAKPDYADALYNLAHIYDKLGDFDKAIYAYRRMIDVKPEIGGIYYQLAIIYLKKEMYDEALKNFLLSEKYSPEKYQPFFQAAVIYHMKKDFRKAIKNYKLSIKNSPSKMEPYINLGDIYLLELHDIDMAKMYYKSANSIYPDNTYCRKRLREIREGKYDGLVKIKLPPEKVVVKEKKETKKAHPSLKTEYIEIIPVSNRKKSPKITQKPDEFIGKKPLPSKLQGKVLQFDSADDLKKLLQKEGIK